MVRELACCWHRFLCAAALPLARRSTDCIADLYRYRGNGLGYWLFELYHSQRPGISRRRGSWPLRALAAVVLRHIRYSGTALAPDFDAGGVDLRQHCLYKWWATGPRHSTRANRSGVS